MVEQVGSAEVEIRANVEQLRKDLQRTRNQVARFTRQGRTQMREFENSIKSARRETQAFDRGMARIGARIGAFAGALAGAATALITFSAVRLSADFEQQMSAVLAITGATEQQFESLGDKARELGATTVFSAKQAAEGMEFLARAGFDANEIIGAIPGTLSLAASGALDLGRAADIASNVLTGFALKTDQANRVADVLAKSAASSNTNVSQLGEGLKLVAPVAAGLGVSLETTTAAVGKLSDAGLQASNAGTGLRRVLAELASPSAELQELMGDLSLETDGFETVMRQLSGQSISTGDALEIFGQRGGPAFAVLVQQFKDLDENGVSSLERLAEELRRSQGFARRTARTMTDNLAGATKEANSAFQELQLTVGDAGALEGFTASMQALVDLLRSDAAREFAEGVGEFLGDANFAAQGFLSTLNDIQNAIPKNVDLSALQFPGAQQVGGFIGRGVGRFEERGRQEAALRASTKELEQQRIDQLAQLELILNDRELFLERFDILASKPQLADPQIVTNVQQIALAVAGFGDAVDEAAEDTEELTEAQKKLQAQRDKFQVSLSRDVEVLRQVTQELQNEKISIDEVAQRMEVLTTLSDLQLQASSEQGAAIAAEIIQRDALTIALDNQRQKTEELKRAQETFNATLAGAQQQVTDLQTEIMFFGQAKSAAAAFRLEQELLRDAAAVTGQVTADQAVEIDNVVSAYRMAASALDQMTEEQRQAEEAIRNLEQVARAQAQFFEGNLNRAFADLVIGGESLSSVFDNLASSIAAAALQATLFGTGPLGQLFGGGSLFGGLLSGSTGQGSVLAGLFHQGGTVGKGSSRRKVPVNTFVNAPRFHDGLGTDEFPAILQRGETVNPRGAQQNGGIQVTIVVQGVRDPDTFNEAQSAIVTKLGTAIERQMSRNR